jgi:hypothetical protein
VGAILTKIIRMMSKLNNIKKHLQFAKENRKEIYLYYGNFQDYDHYHNTSVIESIEIDEHSIKVPIFDSYDNVLFEKHYPLSNSNLFASARTKATLVKNDQRHWLSQLMHDTLIECDIPLNGLRVNGVMNALCFTIPSMNCMFTFDNDCNAKFKPSNKPLLFHEDDEIFTGNFQESKIGKALRYVFIDSLGIELNDKAIEIMTNKIKARYAPIEILTSKSIKEVYNMRQADSSQSGTLSESCMRGKGYLYDWIEESGNTEIAYAVNCDGELIARALIHTNINGAKFMDRIYGSDASVQKFKEYALANNMYHRKRQSYTDVTKFISPQGHLEDCVFNVAIPEIDEDCSPYMDTLKYVYWCDTHQSWMMTNNDEAPSISWCLNETEGNAVEW